MPYEGVYLPEDIFSGNKFPRIKDTPYLLTLGRYDYFWFVLKKEEETVRFRTIRNIPENFAERNQSIR